MRTPALNTLFYTLARLGLTAMVLFSLAACLKLPGTSSGGGSDTKVQKNAVVTLSAFSDFQCSNNWTNRDGALGLAAGSGSGTCKVSFPGGPGVYRISVQVQTEFDGSPFYKVSGNGKTLYAGTYPLSTSSLVCDCPNWRKNCPDAVVSVDAGTHDLKTGDNIEYFGKEVYPCGPRNGAYAKWHAMIFTPL